MGKIVLLDDLTINQIAAGEVIERPANVVKELVENSIDAGATKIQVEIKNGGKSLIKVTDNGKGIEMDDIPNSLERHATSKIRKIEDLENTYTMGFRGEALASISSISALTMITKTKDEITGIRIKAEAGNIIESEEVATSTGTTIIVEQLFFNVPVRYKFLKQDATEFRYIKEWLQKEAMAYPAVSFKLINDGKFVFQTNGSGKIRDIIYQFYGKEISDNLIDVDYEENNIKITGVIGNTRIAKDSRKNQIFFLNKRNIQDKILTNSADQAFKGSTGIGKYGFFILNIDMPASYYDINVHPTKQEVRFKDEDIMYKTLYRAIKTSVLNETFLGNNEQSENKKNYVTDEYNFLTNHFEKSLAQDINQNEKNNRAEIKEVPKIAENKRNYEIQKYTTNNQTSSDFIKREQIRRIDYKYLGILLRTYIIIQIDNDLYLIDQHAAHERILYEQIKANYKNNITTNSQMLLLPEVINLTHKEASFIKQNEDLIRKTGYDIEFFGENTIKINGIPDIEYRIKTNTKDMFLDVLDEILNNARTASKNIEERFIATVACKAAVKAHMDLTRQEVDSLIQGLLTLQNPYTCPHGRPTTIKINKDDLKI